MVFVLVAVATQRKSWASEKWRGPSQKKKNQYNKTVWFAQSKTLYISLLVS